MKKLLFACLILLSLLSYAQTNGKKVKEIGLGFNNPFTSSYSLQYRWGTETKLYRISGNFGGTKLGNDQSTTQTNVTNDTNITKGTSTNSSNSTPYTINADLRFAILHLKPMNEHFGFIFGPVVGIILSANQQKSEQVQFNPNTYANISRNKSVNTNSSLQPLIGIAVGCYYRINSSFSLYLELNPYFSFTHAVGKSESNNYNYSGSNNFVNNTFQTQTNNNFGMSNFSNSGAALAMIYRFSH